MSKVTVKILFALVCFFGGGCTPEKTTFHLYLHEYLDEGEERKEIHHKIEELKVDRLCLFDIEIEEWDFGDMTFLGARLYYTLSADSSNGDGVYNIGIHLAESWESVFDGKPSLMNSIRFRENERVVVNGVEELSPEEVKLIQTGDFTVGTCAWFDSLDVSSDSLEVVITVEREILEIDMDFNVGW